GGGDSGTAPEVGRAPAGVRGAEARADRGARGPARVPRAELLEVLAARRVRVRRRDSAHLRRQVQEERAARALQGLQAGDDVAEGRRRNPAYVADDETPRT